MSEKKKRSCWVGGMWIGLVIVAFLLLIMFLVSTLFGLGVWQEFWEMLGLSSLTIHPIHPSNIL